MVTRKRLTLSFDNGPAPDVTPSVLDALASFTRAFIEAECARFGVTPGSEDLLLRPVDEASDSLCTACGIQNLPPGALSTATQI